MTLRIAGIIVVLAIALLIFTSIARAQHIAIVHKAINKAFCGSTNHSCYVGAQAFTIVSCETGYTYSLTAGIGKHSYWGLFQMGKSERKKYGFAISPWAQATAAKKYYDDRGWRPWDCAYRMGIL